MKLKLTKYVNTQYVNIFKQKFIIFFSKIFETFWQFRFISLLCHSPCNSQANKSLKLKNQLTRPAGKNIYFVFSIVLINFCFVFNSLMKFVQIQTKYCWLSCLWLILFLPTLLSSPSSDLPEYIYVYIYEYQGDCNYICYNELNKDIYLCVH